uniref:BHLH domain-containing protein n=1 Tax=Biomphalaria glabrata TaxID=6526 RepID=A0A2C9KD22_BIOGL
MAKTKSPMAPEYEPMSMKPELDNDALQSVNSMHDAQPITQQCKVKQKYGQAWKEESTKTEVDLIQGQASNSSSSPHLQRQTSSSLSSSHPQRQTSSSSSNSHPQRQTSSSSSNSHPQRQTSNSSSSSHPQIQTSNSSSSSHPQRQTSSSLSSSHPQRQTSNSSSSSHPQRQTSSSLSSSHPHRQTSNSSSSSHPQRQTSNSSSSSHPQRQTSNSSSSSHPQRQTSNSSSSSHPQRQTSSSLSSSHPQRQTSSSLSSSHSQRHSSSSSSSSHPQRQTSSSFSSSHSQRQTSSSFSSSYPQRLTPNSFSGSHPQSQTSYQSAKYHSADKIFSRPHKVLSNVTSDNIKSPLPTLSSMATPSASHSRCKLLPCQQNLTSEDFAQSFSASLYISHKSLSRVKSLPNLQNHDVDSALRPVVVKSEIVTAVTANETASSSSATEAPKRRGRPPKFVNGERRNPSTTTAEADRSSRSAYPQTSNPQRVVHPSDVSQPARSRMGDIRNRQNESERRRRQIMADNLAGLKNAVPRLAQQANASMISILVEARAYILTLQDLHARQEQDRLSLTRKKEALERLLDSIKET